MKVLGANGLQYLITKLMGVDFIVEQGTNGIWFYRKWNSGRMECWGNHAASVSMTTKIGTTYHGGATVNISALGFTSLQNVQITSQASGDFFASKIDTTNGVTSITISDRASASQTATVYHNIYLMGFWK